MEEEKIESHEMVKAKPTNAVIAVKIDDMLSMEPSNVIQVVSAKNCPSPSSIMLAKYVASLPTSKSKHVAVMNGSSGIVGLFLACSGRNVNQFSEKSDLQRIEDNIAKNKEPIEEGGGSISAHTIEGFNEKEAERIGHSHKNLQLILLTDPFKNSGDVLTIPKVPLLNDNSSLRN